MFSPEISSGRSVKLLLVVSNRVLHRPIIQGPAKVDRCGNNVPLPLTTCGARGGVEEWRAAADTRTEKSFNDFFLGECWKNRVDKFPDLGVLFFGQLIINQISKLCNVQGEGSLILISSPVKYIVFRTFESCELPPSPWERIPLLLHKFYYSIKNENELN